MAKLQYCLNFNRALAWLKDLQSLRHLHQCLCFREISGREFKPDQIFPSFSDRDLSLVSYRT